MTSKRGSKPARYEGSAYKLSSLQLTSMPGHLLRRNHQRSLEIFTKVVGDDVTRQQIALLIALSQHPNASQNAVVAVTGIDKGTLREMLGRMIKGGWVIRNRDPNDARAWTLNVTDSGRVLLNERIEQVVRAQDAILEPLPEELRPVFLHCLRVLVGLEANPQMGASFGDL